MTRSRNKPVPRSTPAEEVKSIRFPSELIARIDQARGTVDFSTFVRDRVDESLLTHEERVVREGLEYLRQRGITIEMLIRAQEMLARAQGK